MKNPRMIPILYFMLLFICVLMLFGVHGITETIISKQKSHAANLDTMSNDELPIIQKLQNKQPVTIVAYGDSITWGYERDLKTGEISQVTNPYPSELEKMLRKKYDYQHITIINRGHPGWTSIQALENLEKEVLLYHPDLVITMFGINDARGHKNYSPDALPIPIDQYKENVQQLLHKLNEKRIEVVIVSPTTFTSKKNNAHLNQEQYTNAIKSLLKDDNYHYVNGSDIPIRGNLKDGVHFKPGQYRLIAEKIMTDLFSTN